MIRDITIGQYYPSDSPIHHLDPRVKLFATLLYIIGLFLSKSLIVFAVAGVVLIACIVISKVPFRYMIKGLKPVWILLVVICIVNVFFGKGEVLYFQWKFIHLPGRNYAGGCPCRAVDGADFRFVAYDIHNNADRADGRPGESISSTYEDSCTGA